MYHQDSEMYHQDSDIYHKDSEIYHKDSEICHQDSEIYIFFGTFIQSIGNSTYKSKTSLAILQ